MRPAYRVRQLLHTLLPGESQHRLGKAAEFLSPGQLLLFRAMPPSDQAHGIRVLQSLLATEETDPDLLAAALLHDVGKSQHPIRPWERAAAVLIERLAPSLAQRLGRSEPRGWQRPFAVAAQHPEWGAGLVQEIGGSKRLVRIIRHHQDDMEQVVRNDFGQALRALQAADDRN